MNEILKFFVRLFLIGVGLIVGLLATYIIISVARLYQLDFITQFSFVQVYGIIFVIEFIQYKYEKPSSDEFEEEIKKSIIVKISNTFVYLVMWGLGFLMYYILK